MDIGTAFARTLKRWQKRRGVPVRINFCQTFAMDKDWHEQFDAFYRNCRCPYFDTLDGRHPLAPITGRSHEAEYSVFLALGTKLPLLKLSKYHTATVYFVPARYMRPFIGGIGWNTLPLVTCSIKYEFLFRPDRPLSRTVVPELLKVVRDAGDRTGAPGLPLFFSTAGIAAELTRLYQKENVEQIELRLGFRLDRNILLLECASGTRKASGRGTLNTAKEGHSVWAGSRVLGGFYPVAQSVYDSNCLENASLDALFEQAGLPVHLGPPDTWTEETLPEVALSMLSPQQDVDR